MTYKFMLSCGWSLPWKNVFERMESEGCGELVKAIVWRDDHKSFSNIKKTYIVEDLWKMKLPESNVLSRNISIDSSDLIIAIQMLERQQVSFLKVDITLASYYFQRLVDYWANEIGGIDLIVSPSIPHRFFDYALYVAAKSIGVKFLTFQMIPFGSRIIPTFDIDKIPKLEGKELKSRKVERQLVDSNIRRVRESYTVAEPSYMKMHKRKRRPLQIIKSNFKKVIINARAGNFHKFRAPNTYKFSNSKLPWEARIGWGLFALFFLDKVIKLGRLKRRHRSVADKIFENERNYILFALHYQPEETSCPSAGLYANQLKAINWLLARIEKGTKILVKEHGAQFDLHQEGDCGRQVAFYDALNSISDDVVLIDSKQNTFQLIDASLGVATLTGTIGWEAIQRGRNAIVFGRTWYEDHVNCHRMNEGDTSDTLSEFLSTPIISDEGNTEWHLKLLSHSVQALHYKGWLDRMDINMEDSAENLFRMLVENLEEIGA